MKDAVAALDAITAGELTDALAAVPSRAREGSR